MIDFILLFLCNGFQKLKFLDALILWLIGHQLSRFF